jgi:amyotrophic lateral sclerosis 2 protein
LIPILEHPKFQQATKTFQKITEKFCPSEMLQLIRETYALIDEASKAMPKNLDILNADNLLAVTIYLMIKANIPHLGAELALLEDLMELDMEKLINSHCGYCYTTIKISYLHIVSGQFFQN